MTRGQRFLFGRIFAGPYLGLISDDCISLCVLLDMFSGCLGMSSGGHVRADILPAANVLRTPECPGVQDLAVSRDHFLASAG